MEILRFAQNDMGGKLFSEKGYFFLGGGNLIMANRKDVIVMNLFKNSMRSIFVEWKPVSRQTYEPTSPKNQERPSHSPILTQTMSEKELLDLHKAMDMAG